MSVLAFSTPLLFFEYLYFNTTLVSVLAPLIESYAKPKEHFNTTLVSVLVLLVMGALLDRKNFNTTLVSVLA